MAYAAALGGMISAVGELEEGKSKFRIAQMNSDNSLENARLTRIQTVEEERRQRVLGTKVLGRARASYGASGVQSNEGSALDVLQESARNAEMDALMIRFAGDQKAKSFERESKIYLKGGDAAYSNAQLRAAGSLFSTGAKASAGGG